MRFPILGSVAGVVTAVSAILLVACNDSVGGPSGEVDEVEPVEAIVLTQAVTEKAKKRAAHFARVTGAGALVGGTALSASRLAEGRYLLQFEPPVGGCAATANSASFLGSDGSVFRIAVQVNIGFNGNGTFDDESVVVNTFRAGSGESTDTSFALILICP